MYSSWMCWTCSCPCERHAPVLQHSVVALLHDVDVIGNVQAYCKSTILLKIETMQKQALRSGGW